ncbi:MAG: hypothetical protein QOD58_2846, partial [Mycobacterium sp.]|nr:hypothetical protein [Mycobacterium sp.]
MGLFSQKAADQRTADASGAAEQASRQRPQRRA